MSIKITVPEHEEILRPRITVIGVGGAGGNAVNNMIRSNLEGVEFIVANTDSQALAQSLCDRRIQIGLGITRGLGAGAQPNVGRASAEENLDEIIESIQGSNMVFVTAGLGGGTGSGAAPVIAQAAREQGILTVGVVTKPFHFEGKRRMEIAEGALNDLQPYVDTLIVIPNQNLFRVANENTTFAQAFKLADDVLYSGVRGVTDLMIMPGLINLDFADIRTVMGEMGKAMMGTGEAEGDSRAINAAEAAISNPLLEDASMKGAKGVLINITGGLDMTLFEADEAANRIRDEVDPNANIIFGTSIDEKLEGKIRISVVATGIDSESRQNQPRPLGESMRPSLAQPQAQKQGAAPSTPRFQASHPVFQRTPVPPVQPQPAAAPRPAPAATQDAFIAPAPVEPEEDEEDTPLVFSVSAPSQDEDDDSAEEITNERPAGRTAPSLFERVTGLGRRSAPPQAEPRPKAAKPVPAANDEPAAPQLSSLDVPGDEDDEDATLDIPAFLRRQSS